MAKTKASEIIDNVEALTAKLKAMREAQAQFATFTQEQVDKIFYAAAIAANQARIPLAKMAVAETGMGVVLLRCSSRCKPGTYSVSKDGGCRNWHGRCRR